jgi:hypothetical protein
MYPRKPTTENKYFKNRTQDDVYENPKRPHISHNLKSPGNDPRIHQMQKGATPIPTIHQRTTGMAGRDKSLTITSHSKIMPKMFWTFLGHKGH